MAFNTDGGLNQLKWMVERLCSRARLEWFVLGEPGRGPVAGLSGAGNERHKGERENRNGRETGRGEGKPSKSPQEPASGWNVSLR